MELFLAYYAMLVAVWLAFGVGGALILSGKGRSGCGGFALGILLGPIGLIVALLLSPSEENEAARQLEIERLKQARQQPPPPRSAPQSPSIAVYVTGESTPDGEMRYRWECDRCGLTGDWDWDELDVERSGRSHRCRRTMRRRIEVPVETQEVIASSMATEQTFPDGVVLEAMRTHSRWKCRECGQAGLWTDHDTAQRDAMTHSCD